MLHLIPLSISNGRKSPAECDNNNNNNNNNIIYINVSPCLHGEITYCINTT